MFCATQPTRLLVRDLINQMKTSSDPNYCVRVTADDGELGDQWLRTFQDNEKTIPTILTTSQKLSTGVDARNVRNIVLMRPIGTMIEFKQIIGRGTRLFDGKDYFTIYDFVKAYEHFNDPEWDGEPMEPVIADSQAAQDSPAVEEEGGEYEPPSERPKQIKIRLADGKERAIQHMMATSYWSPDGKPISANQMVEKLFGELPRFFKDEDELRRLWSKPDTRKALLQGLAEKGFGSDQLTEISRMINAENSDVFDVLAYIAFALAPITRSERVETAGKAKSSRITIRSSRRFSILFSPSMSSRVWRTRSGKAQRPAPAQVSLRRRRDRPARRRTGHPRYLRRISAVFVRIKIVTDILTIVTVSITYPHTRSLRDVSGCDPTYGASAVPAGGFADFPRAALGISRRQAWPAVRCALDWDR